MEFKLPDLGEGVTEGEIDRWLVKEGDVVEEDAPLVEVITDKATAEIPSPYAGTVQKIHVGEGEVVPVGTTLITISATDDAPRQAEPVARTSPPASRAPSKDAPGGVKAMPPVRKLARDLGVDISRVPGSGPNERVTRADIEAAVTPSTQARPSQRRIPLRGVRRTIAQRMDQAHRTVPPVTHVEECDVTELEATRNLANERDPEPPRLTFLPFIVKAAIAGLKEYPLLNSFLDEQAGEIVVHDSFNIGVAVDTPAGLMVPVVRDADRKGIKEIGADIDRLATAARAGKLQSVDLQDGTFTVTSPGRFGGLMATPIIFHPQAAILGVHRAAERPVVRDGQVVIRKIMNLSVTFDHRILDGMTGARFILEVVRLLEHPAALLLES